MAKKPSKRDERKRRELIKRQQTESINHFSSRVKRLQDKGAEEPDDVLNIVIRSDASDNDIREAVCMALHRRQECSPENKLAVVLSLNGFDDDVRELNEIPQARALAQRLMKFGMGGVIEPATMIEELATYPVLFAHLGCVELAMLAEGRLGPTGESFVRLPNMIPILKEQNERCIETCREFEESGTHSGPTANEFSDRKHFLEYNTERVEMLYDKCCRAGDDDSVVFLLDMLEPESKELYKHLAKPGEDWEAKAEEFKKRDLRPTGHVAVKREIAVKILGVTQPSFVGKLDMCPSGHFAVVVVGMNGKSLAFRKKPAE